MSRRTLITGVTGQDGSLLAELLSGKGHEVHGVTRRQDAVACEGSVPVQLHVLGPNRSLNEVVAEIQPEEIYHFAADSFVPNGWERPVENVQSNYTMTLDLLEAVREFCPSARLVNACSREVFGKLFDGMANEETEMRPTTPYGINKAASRWMTNAYRDRYGLFATNAILFNHESPRRGENFVTRKVSKGVAEIKLGLADRLQLGATTARRDWGYAGDFVEAMWRMLQIDEPHDFVIGTGVTHSIEDLVRLGFDCVSLDWRQYVEGKPELARVNDANTIAADISKARNLLGWQPKIGFAELVEMMVRADLSKLEKSLLQSGRKAA